MPGEKLVMIELPTADIPNPDVIDLRFSAIEKSSTVSISGMAFFEGEETVKNHKKLYKEMPLLSIILNEVNGSNNPVQVLE